MEGGKEGESKGKVTEGVEKKGRDVGQVEERVATSFQIGHRWGQ